MSAEATTLTPEQLEDRRAKAIADNAMHKAKGRENQLVAIDDAITFLRTNREHIAGLAIVAIPFAGDSLVATDGDPCDGVSRTDILHSGYKPAVREELGILAEQLKRKVQPRAGDLFASLANGLLR